MKLFWVAVFLFAVAICQDATENEEEQEDVDAWFYNHHLIPVIGFWADHDGNLHKAFDLPAGENILHTSGIGHVFEIQNKDGAALGTFQMRMAEEHIHIWPDGKEPGMVDVSIENQSGKTAMVYYRANEDDQEMTPIDVMDPGATSNHGAWRGQIWTIRDSEGNDLMEKEVDQDENVFVIPVTIPSSTN